MDILIVLCITVCSRLTYYYYALKTYKYALCLCATNLVDKSYNDIHKQHCTIDIVTT